MSGPRHNQDTPNTENEPGILTTEDTFSNLLSIPLLEIETDQQVMDMPLANATEEPALQPSNVETTNSSQDKKRKRDKSLEEKKREKAYKQNHKKVSVVKGSYELFDSSKHNEQDREEITCNTMRNRRYRDKIRKEEDKDEKKINHRKAANKYNHKEVFVVRGSHELFDSSKHNEQDREKITNAVRNQRRQEKLQREKGEVVVDGEVLKEKRKKRKEADDRHNHKEVFVVKDSYELFDSSKHNEQDREKITNARRKWRRRKSKQNVNTPANRNGGQSPAINPTLSGIDPSESIFSTDVPSSIQQTQLPQIQQLQLQQQILQLKIQQLQLQQQIEQLTAQQQNSQLCSAQTNQVVFYDSQCPANYAPRFFDPSSRCTTTTALFQLQDNQVAQESINIPPQQQDSSSLENEVSFDDFGLDLSETNLSALANDDNFSADLLSSFSQRKGG